MNPHFSAIIVTVLLALEIHQTSAHDGVRDLRGRKKRKKRCLDFSDIFVFGDSLSAFDNLAAVSPVPFPTRQTNGPLLSELVAGALGLPLTASLHLDGTPPEGNSYAVAGARVTRGPDERRAFWSVPFQVDVFLGASGGVAPSDALYFVQGGGTDILDEFGLFGATNASSVEDGLEAVAAAAESLTSQIKRLIDAGAEKFLVFNVPDVGDQPIVTYQGFHTSKQASRVTRRFNEVLKEEIFALECEFGIEIFEWDVFGTVDEILSATDLQADTPCNVFLGIPGDPPIPPASPFDENCVLPKAEGFVFWDEVHPTTAVYQFIFADLFPAFEKESCNVGRSKKIKQQCKVAKKNSKKAKKKKAAKSKKGKKRGKGRGRSKGRGKK